MFWRMLKGTLTRQWRGKLLVVVTIALGASLATGMLNVMLDVGDKVNRELKAYGANLLVTPRTVSLLSDFYGVEDNNGAAGQYLAEADLGKIKTIFWAYNILGFTPYLQAKATLDRGGPAMTVVGTWFNHRLDLPTGEVLETGVRQLKPWWEIEGSWVEDTDERGALVGGLLARRLGVRPGDELEVVLAGAGGERSIAVFATAPAGGSSPQYDIGPFVTHRWPAFTAAVAAFSTLASGQPGIGTASSYSAPPTDCVTVSTWPPAKYASRSATFTPVAKSSPGSTPGRSSDAGSASSTACAGCTASRLASASAASSGRSCHHVRALPSGRCNRRTKRPCSAPFATVSSSSFRRSIFGSFDRSKNAPTRVFTRCVGSSSRHKS